MKRLDPSSPKTITFDENLGMHIDISISPCVFSSPAPIEEISEDWKKQYELWRDVDVPEWTDEFEEYKEEHTCPTQLP